MGFLHAELLEEWWRLIFTTCVTVWSALVLGNNSWTTIFTAYFFAVLCLMIFKGPDGQEPHTAATVTMMLFVPASFGILLDSAIIPAITRLRLHGELLEWWKLIITTCVTVASALIIDRNKYWTTIFTAYFFAVNWLIMLKRHDGKEPATEETFMMMMTVLVSVGFLRDCMAIPAIMAQSTFLDGWGLTSCIIILTRFFIGMYEIVRPYLIEELLSQEKKKRQRERRGGR